MQDKLRYTRPLGALLPVALAIGAVLAAHSSAAPHTRGPRATLARVPLVFEKNQGQSDHRVDYVSRGNGYTLFLKPDEAVLRLRTPRKADRKGFPKPDWTRPH